MSDPFSLLSLAIAAQGGGVDGFEAQQLVAAGLTLLQRSATVVRALNGKRAAILLPTSPSFFVGLAACEGRGAVLINPLAAPYEISYQLSDANVGVVFTTTALATRVPATTVRVLLDDAPRSARVLFDGTSRDIDLGSHVGLEIAGDATAAGSDDEAVIVYTSAMGGRPLGAVLSHRNLLANARSAIEAVGNSAGDRVLALLPLSHLFGLTVTGTAPLLTGSSVVTMPRFNPARAAELIVAGEITEIVGVPAVFRPLLTALDRLGHALPADRLRVCICGGSPLSVALQDQWFDATGTELRQGYGLSEAGPVCLFNRVDRPNVRGALGVAFPNVEVELHEPITYGEDGIATVTNASDRASDAGEICVRGENVFRGYLPNSAHAAGLPTRNGWLHTGDLGRRDAHGSIVFTGVVKPMFTRNGFNIYPLEIEQVVGQMPGVEHVTVCEIAHDDRESEIALDVSGSVDRDGVALWCAERLSAYKQPTVIRLL